MNDILKNKQILTDYFKQGCKNPDIHSLGMEIEHIICYEDTLEAVKYEGQVGVSYIINELSYRYPDARLSLSGPLLGFDTDKFSITIEPAAQLEISIFPNERISSIENIYNRFRNNLDEIITPLGLKCITLGYQPKSKVNELPLIPKRRYELMDMHFKKTGNHGINMMRGTASVQLSIDYYSNDDFREKFQAAYFLGPYLKLLCDNSPTYEGENNTKNMLRSRIWDDVDKDRCTIVPNAMKPDYSFDDYADYILNMPTIFLPKSITGTEDIYTDFKSCAENLNGNELNEEYIRHFLSMAFPDVRLKNYIEIRYADSLPGDEALSYIALLKGIFYNKKAMDFISNYIKNNKITESDIIKTTNNLYDNGFDGMFYDMNVKEAHKLFFNFAKEYLDESEVNYLKALEEKHGIN